MNEPQQTRDATDRDLPRRLQHAEQELAELRAQLEHSHRLAMLGTLSAGVIHEINNILTPVLAYAQMAGSNPKDTALLAKVAEKTAQGISQATEIADSMLELSRPGSAVREPAEADVADACRAAINCLGRAPEKDGISCTIEIPQDLTCAIRPLALQQVVLNLLLNAVEALKALPDRTRKITIRAWAGGDESSARGASMDVVRIEIADNGPGIPEAIREHLFAPFVTGNRRDAEGATGSLDERRGGVRTAMTGSGLGLSVCRTLIETAGGTIEAESNRDSGTVFAIELPKDRAQSRKIAV